MRLGIGSYTYTWAIGVPGRMPASPLTARELLERAAALGVRVVQFCDNLPLTRLGPADLDEFEKYAREHRLAIEIGTRGMDPGNLLAHLALARRFGAPFLRLVVDSTGHEPTPEEVVESLHALLPQFRDAGVKLALENHDRFASRTLARIVDELGADEAGVCLDTVNSFGALEGPELVVGTLAPYTLNLHVKDFIIRRVSSQMGFIVEGCPAGRGRLNLPWLLEELRAAGRDPNAILELWTPFAHSLELTMAREEAWARESISRLRQLIPD
jgi:sugar phosphate isomerase/epimerase